MACASRRWPSVCTRLLINGGRIGVLRRGTSGPAWTTNLLQRLSNSPMDTLQKALRLSLLALFLTLLIGISNLQHKPVLWVFIALFVAARAAEIFHPAAEGLAEWHRSAAHPRWLAWLSGLTFITNIALPILDHRYRGEVFWASPLPIDTWWSWLGLLGLLAGAVLRWQTFSNVPKPQKSAPSKGGSKRRRNAEESEAEIHKYN